MLYLADILKLGSESHGSFALADSKNALLALAIDYHLQIISDVINNDLIPQTLKLNGFNISKEELPKIKYGDLDEVDVDNFSKFIQRVASVGYLPRSKEVVNEILEKSGFGFRIDESVSDDEMEKLFPESISRSGDGMKTPGEGTSKGVGQTNDSSVSNKENS